MELSLTGISTRQSRKATLRMTKQLVGMKTSFKELPIGLKNHHCIMATLLAEPVDHFKEIKNSDGIYQVEAGYGQDLNFSLPPDQASDRVCLLYTSPSPRDRTRSRMPSSA